MTFLELIVRLIEAIAWPATILFIVKSFHSQLAALIARISKVKHGETEVDFNQKLKEIVHQAEQGQLLFSKQPETIENQSDLVETLLSVDPLSAILVAWVKFSDTAGKLLPDAKMSTNGIRLIESLLEKGFIDSEDANLLQMIRGLRNDAAHTRSSGVDHETAGKVCRVLLVLTAELEQKIQA